MCGTYNMGMQKFQKTTSTTTTTTNVQVVPVANQVKSKPPAEPAPVVVAASPSPAPANSALVVEPVGVEKDPVSVSIRKASMIDRTNLELVSFYEKPGVFVKTIKVGSKFLGTNLQVGMKILRVNGEPCPPDVKETIEMMCAAVDILTLTAVVVETEDDDFMFKEIRWDVRVSMQEGETKEEPASPSSSSPPRAAAALLACFYPDPDGAQFEAEDKTSWLTRKDRMKNNVARNQRDKEGLGLADHMLRQLGVIDDNDGLEFDDYSDQPASTGSFEQEDDEMSGTFYTSPTLEDDENTLTTYGASTLADASPVLAKIMKKRGKVVGIHFVTFKKKAGVYVYRIHKDSKFQNTDLQPGMKVLSINGEACPETVGDTLSLVKFIKGELIIEAIYPSDETEDNNDAASQQRGSVGSSIKGRDQPSAGSLEHMMAVAVPATIDFQPEEKEEEDDDDDDDQSCIDETLPPTNPALTEQVEGISRKALDASGVGNE
jgi:hypothetical protein